MIITKLITYASKGISTWKTKWLLRGKTGLQLQLQLRDKIYQLGNEFVFKLSTSYSKMLISAKGEVLKNSCF